ncbi:MAG: hypothetical protein IJ217_04245 [Clostridia bacterium]|nr:hypothetical protein [Clostridia bacterium]
MKIINFKVSIPKIILTLLIAIFVILIMYALSRFLDFTTNEEIVMTNENYTEILKDCHQNIDQYLGKKIYTIGYVFRNEDFKENEIVIARDMLINQTEAQIVGFLASFEGANEFEDNVWVEVRGRIAKGDYKGEIPVIEIKTIKKITTPEDIFVYPPNKKNENLKIKDF